MFLDDIFVKPTLSTKLKGIKLKKNFHYCAILLQFKQCTLYEKRKSI